MPLARSFDPIKRLTQRTRGRLMLLLVVLVVVWLGSAACAYFALGAFTSFGGAVWSGITHLLDPSSLRDDHDLQHRAVGLFQVIFGLVFLVGLAFTVISEVVGSSLERLGQYDAPVRSSGHLLLIGGPDLVPSNLSRLASARARRAGDLPGQVVVLAPELFRDTRRQYEAELRQAAGALRVRLVVGDTAGPEGFELAAARQARAIVVGPSSARDAAAIEATDLEVIQSGVALRAYLEQEPPARWPSVALTFRQGRDVEAVGALFPESWDAIVADLSLAALLRIAVRCPPFGPTLPLVDLTGNGVYAVAAGGLAGLPLAELADRFEVALPVGALRGEGKNTRLVVAPEGPVGDDDRIVVLAPDREAAERPTMGSRRPGNGPSASGPANSRARTSPAPSPEPSPAPGAGPAGASELRAVPGPRRVLLVGWNDLARALLMELAREPSPPRVTVLASEAQLHGFPAPALPQVTVERLHNSMTDPGALREALDRVRPEAVVVVSAPVPGRDTAHADAEAVLAVMHVRSMTWQAEVPIVAHVFTRLQALEATDNPWLTVVHSQEVMAGALAVVVMERSSATAAGHLLEGIDARFEVRRYQPEPQVRRTFGAIHRAALARGTAVLGLASDGRAVLNPPRDALVRPGDLLLVARQR